MSTIRKYKIPQLGILAASATACLAVGVTGDWEAIQLGGEDYPQTSEDENYAGEIVTTYRAMNMSINADNTVGLTVDYSLTYDGGAPEEETYNYSGTYTMDGGNHVISVSGDSYDLEFVCTLNEDDSLGCDAYVDNDEIVNGATFIRNTLKN